MEAVQRDLGAFVEAVQSSEELQQFLVAEEISDAKKKIVLADLTEGGEEMVRNLLYLLVDKRREAELVNVHAAFVSLVERAQGLVHVEVVTAVPLSSSIQEIVKDRIASSLNKTVELTTSVDKEILGGLKLRIGDRVADASVRYRLNKLREILTGPMASLEDFVETAS